ncbi:MAG TPA: LPS assembly protein LptD [Planctomycetota bacterium]|nr:LPS assembly protein LptD [Planctomycetota bacterium]
MKRFLPSTWTLLTCATALMLSSWGWCVDGPADAAGTTTTATTDAAEPTTAAEAVDVPAAPEPPPALPVSARGDAATRWRDSGFTVLMLTGHVELTRGGARLEAERALVWIDEGESAKRNEVVMSVYAEGEVLTREYGVETMSPQVYFGWTGSTFTVDDADGFIAVQDRGALPGFVARGEAVRRSGAVPVEARVIPPRGGLPAGVVPPGEITGQILPPTRIAHIYGQQQEGPDIKTYTEGDYRVTVVTRYPDVVFTDPGSTSGQFEVLAENMVIWVNEKKLQAGERLREAELEIYAEGHVVIYEGQKTVVCDQLYYDYKNQRALLSGGPDGRAMFRTWHRTWKIPLYYRAKEFRQLSADRYAATDAIVTTCEFVPPEWGIYAKRMDLTTTRETVTDAEGQTSTRVNERAEVWSSRIKAHGLPVFYWPHWTMDLNRERTALKKFEIGNSSRFGFTVRTGWDLYNFGIYENAWSDLTLLLDYFSDRGVGVGFQFDYERDTYWGELFAYGISDSGIDRTGFVPEEDPRARVKWRHRQQLNPDWRFDAELSWINDAGFLDEYFEEESREEKEQETVGYLRYLKDNRYFALEGRWRLNDFQTQLERMPEARFVWLGQPLLGGLATYITDSRLGNLRQRFSDDLQDAGLAPADYRSWRFHTAHEVQIPFAIGPVKLAPFVDAAYTYYENTVEDGHDRVLFGTGVRASATFWKIYNFHNRLWDINRFRHIVTPTVDVLTTWVRTKNPGDILQFDDIDALDDTQLVRFGLRQRLQTRRLARSIEPALVGGWYTVNWMVLDLEIDWYPSPDRHNAGQDLGPMRVEYLWQLTDRVALLSHADVRVDTGFDFETFDIGFAVNRSPKLFFYLGQRYIDESGSNIFIGQVDYKLNERWSLGGLVQYDFGLDSSNLYRASLRRRMHRWVLEMMYEHDASDNENTFMMYISPQGVPEARFRFF